jgi:hypothetical protein
MITFPKVGRLEKLRMNNEFAGERTYYQLGIQVQFCRFSF